MTERRSEILVQNAADCEPEVVEALEAWLQRLSSALEPRVDSFCLRLASDDEVRTMNRELRGKDRSTDVLSFPGESGPDGVHLGDVIISVPVAVTQAANSGWSLTRELQELTLHGVLHCQGYDHETDGGEMNQLEVVLREKWIHD